MLVHIAMPLPISFQAQLPLIITPRSFVGEAVLIDVTHVQERKLRKEVLHNADIKEGDIVIFHSNLSTKWNTEAYEQEAFIFLKN